MVVECGCGGDVVVDVDDVVEVVVWVVEGEFVVVDCGEWYFGGDVVVGFLGVGEE